MGQDHTQEFLHELIGIKKMVEQLEQKNKSDMQMLNIYKSAGKPQNMDDTSKKLLDSQTKITHLTEDNQRLQDRIDYLDRAVEHLTNVNNANTDQNKKLELENSYLKKQVLDLQSKTHGVQTLHEVKPEDIEAGTSINEQETMMRAVHHAPKTIMGAATTENTLLPSGPVQPEHRESMVMRGAKFIAGGLGFGGSSPAKASGSTHADQYLVTTQPDIIAPISEDEDVLGMKATDIEVFLDKKSFDHVKGKGANGSLKNRLNEAFKYITQYSLLQNYRAKYHIKGTLTPDEIGQELRKIAMCATILVESESSIWQSIKNEFFNKFLGTDNAKEKRVIASALAKLTPEERNDLRTKLFPFTQTDRDRFIEKCENFGITIKNGKGKVNDYYHYAMENTETVTEYV